MAERDLRKSGNENLRVNSQIIDLAVLRLLSLFLADKEIQKLISNRFFPYSWSILDETKEEQIVHHLIEIATLYRTQEYQIVMPKEKKKEMQKKRIVGDLLEPIGSPKKSLIMIEACNKIIHADTFNYDERKLPKYSLTYLYPRIYIYGKKYTKKWKAILDITKFCKQALRYDPPAI